MSHVVQIETQVLDAAAVDAACRRLKLPGPANRIAREIGTKGELPRGGRIE